MCIALRCIHKRNILHRDIKSANIFIDIVDGVTELWLGDFGVGKDIRSTTDAGKTFVGTRFYMSPEVYQEVPYKNPADI